MCTIPAGGYTLHRRGFAVKLEVGYPHADIELLAGLHRRIHLGVGYRSFYSMSHAPYAELKWSFNGRHRHRMGLAMLMQVGYSFPRTLGDLSHSGNELTGEYGALGGLWLMGTARRGRHGLLLGVGGVISQSIPDDGHSGYEPENRGPVMGKVSLEMGYELRINQVASFYLALGVDMFINNDFLPALPRFRLGLLLGS